MTKINKLIKNTNIPDIKGVHKLILKEELTFVIEKFSKIPIDNIIRHSNRLKAHGEYKDLKTRLVWDCLRAVVPSETICGWYNKYNCNDKHIDSLIKKAFDIVWANYEIL